MAITITYPKDGDIFTVGDEITFTGTANDGITRVEVFAEETWLLGKSDVVANTWSVSYSFNSHGNPRLVSTRGFDASNELIETAKAKIVLEPELKNLPIPNSSGWHNRFGGAEWRYDAGGVYLRDYHGGTKPLRTPGQPVTCTDIWNLFKPYIVQASLTYNIPPELIIMTIATETGFARRVGFTGPTTFRWEAGVDVTDDLPLYQGDYSAGPMQTLATTARWVIKQQRLDYDAFAVAPPFRRRPDPRPTSLPLYEPKINIDIGTAEIKQRWNKTGDDPVLVAAAFNAGGIYESDGNRFHLRTYGSHLDRAIPFYGDACTVLSEIRG